MMNPPEHPTGGTPPPPSRKELQIQGPRPPPLKVSKESHKIKKPPLPPPPHAVQHHAQPEPNQQQREPVIIYSISPKVIHVAPGEFMDVVQRLTGPSPAAEEPSAGRGDVSPAARLASIEKTSPSEKERGFQNGSDDMMWMLEEGVELGQFPGILTPEPGNLPPLPTEVFSPVRESQTASFSNEFWSASPSGFLSSPSGFISVAMGSPQPSPNLFSLFDW